MSTQPAGAVNPAPAFRMIPLKSLSESKSNPRKHFDDKELERLTKSVEKSGILEPLIVRPSKTTKKHQAPNYDTFEVVAGARRYRAGAAANLIEVPCIIHENLSDDDALEIQMIENVQRADVHPVEEADGYRHLMSRPGYTAELLAEKIGKDVSYIYRRLQLSNLIEPLKGLFFKEEIGLQHALRICRLPEPAQIQTAKEGLFREENIHDGKTWARKRMVVSTAQLDGWIRTNIMLDLSKVPWALDDATVLPAAGSCTNCPKRTGANHELFDDPKAGDRCLDGSCYKRKTEAHLNLAIAQASVDGVKLVQIASSHVYPMPKHVAEHHSYVRVAAKKPCEHAERAIVVLGSEDIGKQFLICKSTKCTVHASAHHGNYRPKPQTAADLWREKAKNLEARITAAVRQEVFNAVLRKLPGTLGRTELDWVAETLIKRHQHETTKELAGLFGLEMKTGTNVTQAVTNHVLSARAKGPEKTGGRNWFTFNQCLLAAALIDQRNKYHWQGKDERNLLDLAAAEYGVDEKKIKTAIAGPMRKKFAAAKAASNKRVAVMKGKIKKASAVKAAAGAK